MDQQLIELIEELRRLIPVLKTMGSTQGTSAPTGTDRGNDRLVNAIARLTATIDTNNKTKAQQDRSMSDFVKGVDKATDAQDAQRVAQEAAARSAKEAAQVVQDAADAQAEAMRRAGLSATELAQEDRERARQSADEAEKRDQSANKQLLESLRDRRAADTNYAALVAREEAQQKQSGATFRAGLEKLAGSSVGAQQKVNALMGTLDVLATLGKSFGKFAGELANGNTKFTTLNPLIDSVAGALGDMAKAIPFAGSAIAGGIKIVAEGSKFVIEQLQKTTETFKELGEVGALTATGMSGIQRGFLESGMSMEGYKKVIVSNSEALAKFGGTVGEGRDTLTRLTGSIVDSKAGDELRRIGYSADQIGETAAAFITQQTRLGLARNKTEAQLKAGTTSYAKELDLLSKVTGMSRTAIQKQQDAALSEGRFRAQTDEMIASGNVDGAKAIRNFQTVVSNVTPELGAAIRDTTTGFTNSDAAIKGFNATGGQLGGIIDDLKNNVISEGEALARLQQATRDNEETQRNFAKAAGDTGDVFVKYAELSDFNRAVIEGNTIKAKIAQDAQIAGQDDLTNKTVEAQKQLEQMSRQLANFGFTAMPAAATAVRGFTTALNDFIKFVAKTTGMQLQGLDGNNAGTGGTGGVPPDIRPATQQKVEAVAAQTRQESDVATEKLAVSIAQRKAAEAELETMKKTGAAREDRRKQEEKITALVKQEAEAQIEENKAAYKARQAALEAKNERQRILKLQNSVAPIEKEITSDKIKLTSLKDREEDQSKAVDAEKDPRNKAAMTYTLKSQRRQIEDLEASIKDKEAKLADIQKQIKPATPPAAAPGSAPAAPGSAPAAPGSAPAKTPVNTTPALDASGRNIVDERRSDVSRGKNGLEVTKPPAAQAASGPKTAADITAQSEGGGRYDLSFGDKPQRDGSIKNVLGSSKNFPSLAGKQIKTPEEYSGKPLTSMTLAEVKQFQDYRQQVAPNTNAVGRYGFMRSVLFGRNGLVEQSKLPMDTVFSPEIQEKLQSSMRQQNAGRLAQLKVPPTDVNLHLANMVGADGVAAMLRPENANRNAIDVLKLTGAGATTNPHLNKSVSEVIAGVAAKYGRDGMVQTPANTAMTQTPTTAGPAQTPTTANLVKMANGGVIKARPGGTQVLAAESGKDEAFVPLPDGKAIPVKIKPQDNMLMPKGGSTTDVGSVNFATRANDLMPDMRNTLDNLAEALSSNNNGQDGVKQVVENLGREITRSLNETMQRRDNEISALLAQMVDLHRAGNATSTRLLQVAVA